MSCQRFTNKVVIVTGSSSGIGQGIALLLAQQGANVTIHGLDIEEVQETYELLMKSGVPKEGILMIAGDLCDPETCEKLVKETISKWGKLDVLVNNAGVYSKIGVPLDSEENFDYTFDMNVKSVVRMNKLAIPHLQKSKGNIVNTCSVSALMRIRDTPTFYAMSKIALDHYVKYEASRLAEMGIRMNNVAPGIIRTKILVRVGFSQDAYDKLAQSFVDRDIPLGRVGMPRDIAHAVAYMASEDASYVTGSTLQIDGGVKLGKP